jgi:NADH-quinone oxidoreductase subunit L
MALMDYAWLIPALPLAAAAVVALLGLRTPEKGGWIAVLLVGLAGALSLGVFYEGLRASPVSWDKPFLGTPGTPTNFNWFTVGDLKIDMGVYLDPLTIFMLFTVGILVTLIALYSIGYMHDEGTGRRRYFAELTLFIAGMLGLVVANNYLMLFVFWEIMGLCSYLLIGYWYAKPSAASAAKKAFLTTRVGDAFFLVGLGILFTQFHTLNFNDLFSAAAKGAPGIDRNVLLLANSCVFIGAVGKSAQFPLHTWLPDAMEGPTTVSALIHAATMVKAGVYLVARSYPLFVLTPQLLVAVAIIGGFTALFAASLALTNWDLKRVLAYSTLSQLGYMFLGLGVAGALYWSNGGKDAALVAIALTGVTVAIFHLFSHAFFKAGLFLSAGSVGHSFHGAANPYDMRQMGGLRKFMPITTFAMLMGCISISGIPPFSGFFSKDAIIGAVWKAAQASSGSGALLYYALYAAAVLTAGMTAYYMFRLYFLTFEGEHRGLAWALEKGVVTPAPAHDVGTPSTLAHAHDPHMHAHAGPAAPPSMHDEDDHHDAGGHDDHAEPHEGPWTMTLPLVILGLFAILGGLIALSFAGGSFSGFIHASAGTTTAAGGAEAPEQLSLASAIIEPFADPMTYVTLVAAIVGIALAWSWWGPTKAESNIKSDADVTGIARVWSRRYYIDQLYDTVFGRWVLRTATVEDAFDREVVDGAVNGVATVNDRAAGGIRRWNTGFVQDYALTMLAGLIVIVLIAIYAPQLPDFWHSYIAPNLPGGR